ncbi:isopeptide-forming domain-containing fimbrial protein, partial [Vagococcus fluvialis]|uniref:isopeptide-forming domain-containing fimbrial protein n=2 Tax=Bacteria TaxID=2 RepID=UPI003D0B137E
MKSLKKWYSLFLVLVISVATIVQPIQVVSAVVVDSVLETTDSDEAATEISESNQKVETESIAEKTISDEKVVENNSKEVEKNKGAPVGKNINLVSTSELNQEKFVDDITLPGRLKRGEADNILVSFSSKIDSQVKPNDTLTLELPKHLVGTRANSIAVKGPDGVQYGTMQVFGNQAIVTFNEKVSNYKVISGELIIPITGELLEDEGKVTQINDSEKMSEVFGTTNLGTDSVSKNYEVWRIDTKPGESTAIMYSKSGSVKKDYSYDIVEYRIQVKAREYDVVNDIELIDTLDEHQYIPNESELNDPHQISLMEIVYSGEENSRNMTIQQFIDEGYGTYELLNDKSFKMSFNKEKANGNLVEIYYRAKLTDKAKTVKPEKVYNTATEKYFRVDQSEEKIETKEVFPPVSYPDATARPDKGSLWIIKKKQVANQPWDDQSLLSGVIFNVYHKDGTLVTNGENLVTDKDGKIELPNLEVGEYYAQEVEAPSDVSFDKNQKYEFTIDSTAKYGIVLAISNVANKINGILETEKLVNKDELKVGEVATYTIVARNIEKDGEALTNVIVEDNLPKGLSLIKGSIKVDGKSAEVEEKVNGFKLIIPSIAGGKEVKVSFDAKVTNEAEKTIKNVAIVIPEDPEKPGEPGEPQNPEVETPVKPVIPTGKLEATKTADKKEVKVGDVITYTINATNTVKDSLLNPVVITDNLPEGLELVKDSVKASDKDAKV